MKRHTEARLEDAIVESLTQQGGFVFVDYRAGAGAGPRGERGTKGMRKVLRQASSAMARSYG